MPNPSNLPMNSDYVLIEAVRKLPENDKRICTQLLKVGCF
jgi:hypothetical protein